MIKFPSTRYQGSKTKLGGWIWEQVSGLKFNTCLDAFGGTGSISYRFKQENREITYNDILRFNYYFGVALIENANTLLSEKDINSVLVKDPGIEYPSIIQDNFHDIYYTDAENAWLDQAITNIYLIKDKYKFALAFFALCQSCLIKRPYNLFHRKNLYIRLAEVKRSFGNKTTWDKPFSEWFRFFSEEANKAVFDNGRSNLSLNCDSKTITGNYDLVYIDPPYIPRKGTAVDYRDFYHFLEGLTMYKAWTPNIDNSSKHRRLLPFRNEWTDKKKIYNAFDNLFKHFRNSIIVVSYRSDGTPGVEEILALLKKYKNNVEACYYGNYKYVLSTNEKSEEVLLIGY